MNFGKKRKHRKTHKTSYSHLNGWDRKKKSNCIMLKEWFKDRKNALSHVSRCDAIKIFLQSHSELIESRDSHSKFINS